MGVTVLVDEKTSVYLAIELSLRKSLTFCTCARAHLHALMTQKSCAVGMRNAKLGNHFKRGSSFCSSSRPYFTCHTRRFVAAAYKKKIPLISRQLTTNKAFKRGSSFCSLTRLNLQNEDPINFPSVDNEQSV